MRKPTKSETIATLTSLLAQEREMTDDLRETIASLHRKNGHLAQQLLDVKNDRARLISENNRLRQGEPETPVRSNLFEAWS
jgi:hypothetical protein